MITIYMLSVANPTHVHSEYACCITHVSVHDMSYVVHVGSH